jgi:hypothetical protein
MRFLLLVLLAIDMMALSVDPLLLQAQASVFPKIMLLDNAISNKIKANRLVLDIVHTDAQTASATKLKSVIDTEYNNRLGPSVSVSDIITKILIMESLSVFLSKKGPISI